MTSQSQEIPMSQPVHILSCISFLVSHLKKLIAYSSSTLGGIIYFTFHSLSQTKLLSIIVFFVTSTRGYGKEFPTEFAKSSLPKNAMNSHCCKNERTIYWLRTVLYAWTLVFASTLELIPTHTSIKAFRAARKHWFKVFTLCLTVFLQFHKWSWACLKAFVGSP